MSFLFVGPAKTETCQELLESFWEAAGHLGLSVAEENQHSTVIIWGTELYWGQVES